MSFQVKHYHSNLSFLDLAYNVMAVFTGLFMLAFIMLALQVNAKVSDIETKSEFMIVLSWPDGNRDDVDLWVKDPAGNIVFFGARETGFMTLDRDDMGTNDSIKDSNGKLIQFVPRRENVSIRGIMAGEYIVNVHMYGKRTPIPTPVTVEILKINPFQSLCTKKVTLELQRQEETMCRFTIDDAGKLVGETNDLHVSVVSERHPEFMQENMRAAPRAR